MTLTKDEILKAGSIGSVNNDKEIIEAILQARKVLNEQKVPRPHYLWLPGMDKPEHIEAVLNKKLKLTYTLDV